MTTNRSVLAVNTSMGNVDVTRPTVIRKREFLGEWSVPYAIEGYELNPGVYDTFAYAPKFAKLFEEYHVDAFEIEVVPTCAATAAGMVTIAVDKDPLDAAPVDEAHMETRTYWKTGPIREPMRLRLDPKLIHDAYGRLYVRAGPVINADLKTYDFGKLYVTATGPVLASAFRIYITYQFSFYCPNIEDDVGVQVTLPRIPEPTPHTSAVPWRVDQMVDMASHFLKLLSPRSTTAVGTSPIHGWSGKFSPVWQAMRNFEGVMRVVGHGWQDAQLGGGIDWTYPWAVFKNSTGPDAEFHQCGTYSGDPLGCNKWIGTADADIFEQGLMIPAKWNAGDYVTIGGVWDSGSTVTPQDNLLRNGGSLWFEPQPLTWLSTAQEQALLLDKLVAAANKLPGVVISSSSTDKPGDVSKTLKRH